MSKKKDTRQLLIESSEFVTKILLPQTLKESLEISNSKAGTLIVRNIPATILNRENQNGRIYTTEVLQEAIDEAKRLKAFELKGMLGKPNEHPEGSYIAPSEASHVVINAYIKKNTKIVVEGVEEVHDVLFMDWEVLNTQNGKDLRALFEAECSIGVSIRGLGDLEGKYVKNYTLISCDCVGNPSSSTFTRMPVSESVKIELKNNKDLQEGFTVSSSSTTVVKDLEQASVLQAKLEDINYGTVVKTSTKLDSETDPKTGAETTITTLEAETEDEVSDLDQALIMAKNAMLNGYVDVDSVTIENVKEEQPKESTENFEDKSLNEEDDETDPHAKCEWCGEDFAITDMKKDKNLGWLCNTCQKAIISREGKDSLSLSDSDYIPESEINEAELTDEYIANHTGSPEKVAENMVQRQYNFIISNTLEADSLRQQAENIFAKFEQGKVNAIDTKIALGDIITELQKKIWSESTLDEAGVDKLYDIITSMMWNEGLTVEEACRKFCEKNNNIPYEYLVEYMKTNSTNESTITEAKEDKKNPNEGKKFVLKTPSGFVAMDGNALVFKENPKEALHFIVGKEESGLVHLSGVQKILDTMGVYDVEKYYRKPTTDISTVNSNEAPIENKDTDEEKLQEFGDINIGDVASNNDVSIPFLGEDENTNETKLNEEDNTGGKYTAIVETEGLGGEVKSEEIPVASTELSSMQNEIGNLWQQKSQNGKVTIKIRDNEAEKTYVYNPELNNFEELTESLSNDGEIQQDGNKLSLDIDKDHKVEKKFDTEAQASVAKAGVEKGDLDGSVLLNEEHNQYTDPIYYVRDMNQFISTGGNVNEDDLNIFWTTFDNWRNDKISDEDACNKLETIRRNVIKNTPNILYTGERIEEDKQYEDIKPGWYITCPSAMEAGINIGILGPFESKEKAINDIPELKEYESLLNYEYISPEDLSSFDENNMNEVLYNKPSDPSDPYVDETLNEDEDSDISKNNIKELNIEELSDKDSDLTNDSDISLNSDMTDNSEDIHITLGDIDWDIDSISNNFMTNAQDDDVVTQDDLESLINELPDTLSLTLKASDIDMDEPDKVKEVLLDLANKSSGLKINNAMILDIK